MSAPELVRGHVNVLLEHPIQVKSVLVPAAFRDLLQSQGCFQQQSLGLLQTLGSQILNGRLPVALFEFFA
jgi:hypothetical protein